MHSEFYQRNTTRITSGSQSHQRFNLQQVASSVSDVISEALTRIKPRMIDRDLQLELDLQPIEARFDRRLVGQALSGLLENAVDSSPCGSELTLTSVDSRYQWEIEVADSSRSSFDTCGSDEDEMAGGSQEDLPVVIPFPGNASLRSAYRAAFAHGGDIQSWRCPLGGMAYVLTIPRIG